MLSNCCGAVPLYGDEHLCSECQHDTEFDLVPEEDYMQNIKMMQNLLKGKMTWEELSDLNTNNFDFNSWIREMVEIKNNINGD